MAPFEDRADGGRALAAALASRVGGERVVVLALPRGGVPVAFPVARALGATLDILLVRKLGLPGRSELAMGAIASGGIRVLNEDVVEGFAVPPEEVERVTREEARELERRETAYRGDRPRPRLEGATVVLVDDGLATGATMRAAIAAVRAARPARVIVGVPVGSEETCHELARFADEVVCAERPEPFHAVGLWYHDFTQTGDEEVRELLERAAPPEAGAEEMGRFPIAARAEEVSIPVGGERVSASLRVPAGVRGVVVFAHGSGSSRFSPRNRYVAGVLEEAGFATLLADLLTPAEEQADRFTGRHRFDVRLLGARLVMLVEWLKDGELRSLPVGLFGASTGAAAALIAAASLPGEVQSVVSRGGRPDLAGDVLERVLVPVLLAVGGQDTAVLHLNRRALARLAAPERELAIVPEATHLFEEPGALERVAALATEHFRRTLADAAAQVGEHAARDDRPPAP